ncbi:MAG: hypothetical protein ABR509_04910 [Candidatus Limnocylindria bacterium]
MPVSFEVPTSVALEGGVYSAVVAALEPTTSSFDGSDAVKWFFDVVTGDGPVTVTDISSTKFGRQAKARQWAEAIVGREFRAGDRLQPDDLIGRQCELVLTVNDRGFNKVADVRPAARQSPQSTSVLADEIPF